VAVKGASGPRAILRSVRSLRDIDDAHEGLLRELTREKAAALARIGGRLGELVTELDRRRARWAAREEPLGASERLAFRALRDEARRFRWYLEVQREAVGVRGHARLDELYPIPASPDP
jgi:hypothetical protein